MGRGDIRVWTCVTNVDCPSEVKVVAGDYYELSYSLDKHAERLAPLPENFKGISAEFAGVVKEFVSRGYTPSRIHSELLLLCGDDEQKKQRVPNQRKISARRQALLRTPEFQFATFADMREWAERRLVKTKKDFDNVKNAHDVLVFKTFNEKITIEDEAEGAAERAMIESSTFGFIYGTKQTMYQLRHVCHFV